MRNVAFTREALEDLTWLVRHERKLALRLLDMIEEMRRAPFDGVGKPEPLRGQFAGCWSRRIDRRHRAIYTVDDKTVTILACRGHYTE